MNIGIIGNKRVGKSSIVKVVFQKLSPNETLFLETTTRVEELNVKNNPHLTYKILDFPGSFEITYMSSFERKMLQSCAMLIYVIDAQDQPYNRPLEKLVTVFTEVHSLNPSCLFEVFIHKIDGDMYSNEDEKLGIHNEIVDTVRVESSDRGIPEPSFYLTSIYNLTIYEALSRVMQKVSPYVACFQNILDDLVTNCKMDKVYVFDVITKLYIATDCTPVDLMSYELCTDMIDVVVDVSCIYG